MIPVNKPLREILERKETIDNAGLLLDKYHAACPGQQEQKEELAKVAGLGPKDGELARRLKQRRAALDALGAIRWTRRSCGPLTLQLSRAGSFENAGLCLHPVHGFVYLPGSGVKGMARAFAETVAQAGRAEVEAVFGKAATKEEESAAGGVVFHEAWPVKWPRLVVDIVTSHHREYYEKGDEKHPPDDFEEPNPVSFLAVPAGAEFEFAIGPRQREAADQRLVELGREWLDGALTLLGAGAKTNAGYGRFQAESMPALGTGQAQFTAGLALETPAFLAGAMQGAADCELRPATLRGLLRWWWRTLHSAHLSVSQLRRLEAQVWGDTEAGGPVALQLEPMGAPPVPQSYDPRRLAPRSPNPEITQGLAYGSYGMAGSPKRPARYFLGPGARWRLIVTARDRGGFTAAELLDQARLALWLLGRYGGAGAKARRGFGALAVSVAEAPGDLSEALRRAAAVRPKESRSGQPVSSSIEWMKEKELRLGGNEPWFALDQLGYAYQSFASREKHKPDKWALGLPRRTRILARAEPPFGGLDQRFSRFASPLHFHVFRDGERYAVRIAAFSSLRLPDLKTSGDYLARCVSAMESWLREKETEGKPEPAAGRVPTVVKPERGPAPPAPVGLRVGDRVTGTLVEKSARGTWKVQVEGFLRPGPIQNSREMPARLEAGETVPLKVKINKPKDPAFDWIQE